MADNDRNDPPTALSIRVRDRLRADDGILALADTEFLEVELTEALSHREPEEMLPRHCLRAVALFVRDLNAAAVEVAGRPFFPDVEYPNGPCEFRANDNFIVAYHGRNPVWFWKNGGGEWVLHMVRVQRRSNISDVFEEVFPYMFGDAPLSEVNGVFHQPGVNDPERLIPDALLGVLAYFRDTLNRAHRRMEETGAPYLPEVGGVDDDFRFRSDGEFIVTYTRDSDEPLWCWKRRKDEWWKLYRLLPFEGRDYRAFDDLELREGDWD